jgi:hypothetical protein
MIDNTQRELAWWPMSIIPLLGRLGQRIAKFQDSLSNTGKNCVSRKAGERWVI